MGCSTLHLYPVFMWLPHLTFLRLSGAQKAESNLRDEENEIPKGSHFFQECVSRKAYINQPLIGLP